VIDKDNNWLSDKGIKQIDFYLSSSDVILIERNRTLKLLLDIFSFNFREKSGLSLLELGCGDGFITGKIAEKYSDNTFHLLDGSGVMLEKAKENLKGDQFKTICMTFEDFISNPADFFKYDFIYSSMAIHHLDFENKCRLYSRVFHELKFGGLFLNIDVILPATEKTEEWQFQMWRDWMNEIMLTNKMEKMTGSQDGLPDIYKNKAENKPSRLFDQLEYLKKAGFRNVDSFYQYGNFALFGGTKE
jgi:tRNA (cmo5U34)-methyltransferase